jgi:hypothetical protein
MKTAYDLMNRLNLLSEYIGAIHSGKNAISTWNEEFGEGNPEVNVLENLIHELQHEKAELENKLRSIEV